MTVQDSQPRQRPTLTKLFPHPIKFHNMFAAVVKFNLSQSAIFETNPQICIVNPKNKLDKVLVAEWYGCDCKVLMLNESLS